jgi:hypothetical protein
MQQMEKRKAWRLEKGFKQFLTERERVEAEDAGPEKEWLNNAKKARHSEVIGMNIQRKNTDLHKRESACCSKTCRIGEQCKRKQY